MKIGKRSSTLIKDDFIEILQDKDITRADDLKIFQTLYSFENHEASATDVALELGWKGRGALVLKNVGMVKRIIKKYDIQLVQYENGKPSYYDVFFGSFKEGEFYIYQFKPNLKMGIHVLFVILKNTMEK